METAIFENSSSTENGKHPEYIGERPSKNNPPSRHFWKWILFAPLGMCLVGFGLCLFATAHDLKVAGDLFINWFLLGTLSLVLINAGLAFIGEAVKSRVMMELRRKRRSSAG
ncbi:MAG: hypothetical protein H7Y04_16105 [Verrucomicrobia bacterium]|nr:hypothetical protein [Cytophagales bacterium]